MARWATPQKLFKRKKLVIILAGTLIVIALAVSLPLSLIQPPYKCTLDDIFKCPKTRILMPMIQAWNLSLNDTISIVLDFDHKLSEDEIQELKQLGLVIDRPCIPTVGYQLWTCGAECRVGDLCKLIDSDLVKNIEPGTWNYSQ